MVIWLEIALAVVGVAVFLTPHHWGNGTKPPMSLWGNLRQMIGERPPPSPRGCLIGFGLLLGCVAPLLPAAVLLTVDRFGGRTVGWISGGVLLIGAGVGAFFMQLISELLFGLGSPRAASGPGVNRVFVWLFPVVCGVAAIVAALRGW